MSRSGLLFTSRAESHRFIHGFAHINVVCATRNCWNNRNRHVLLFRASELERETKHGTPATSVAGVYAFMGNPPRNGVVAVASATDGGADPSTTPLRCVVPLPVPGRSC